MTEDRDVDFYSWVGATTCLAVGLFALWVGIDSAIELIRGELLVKNDLLDLLAVPIGLGFVVAAIDIVRPVQESRVAALVVFAFWPMLAMYIIAALLSQPFNAPHWGRLGPTVLVWTVLILLFIGWRRLTEPRP